MVEIKGVKEKQERCKKEMAAEHRSHFKTSKKQRGELRERHKKMKEECGIVDHRITYSDYNSLIIMVLETGESGRVVLTKYAEQHKKGTEWRKTIARKGVSKVFRDLLNSYEEHYVIKRLIENNIYNKKVILRSSLSGALTQLSKQIKLSKNFDEKDVELKKRDEIINIKDESKNKSSKELAIKAQQLRDEGYTTREIAMAVNMSPAWVSKYTKPLGG